MMRNLKAVLLAALAVTAFGAVAASGASAAAFTVPSAGAGDETTLTTLKDGTGKTAHHVFDIRKPDGTGVLSITCNELTAHATVTGPSNTDITAVTPLFEGGGIVTAGGDATDCTFAGQTVKVENTGCNFTFTADGTLHITSEFAATPNLCKHGEKAIHFTNTTLNCKVEVGEQTVTGIKYHNLVDGTVTVEATNLAVTYNATGAGCAYGTLSNGLFTTGNAIVTGEKKGTSEMVEVKWDA